MDNRLFFVLYACLCLVVACFRSFSDLQVGINVVMLEQCMTVCACVAIVIYSCFVVGTAPGHVIALERNTAVRVQPGQSFYLIKDNEQLKYKFTIAREAVNADEPQTIPVSSPAPSATTRVTRSQGKGKADASQTQAESISEATKRKDDKNKGGGNGKAKGRGCSRSKSRSRSRSRSPAARARVAEAADTDTDDGVLPVFVFVCVYHIYWCCVMQS